MNELMKSHVRANIQARQNQIRADIEIIKADLGQKFRNDDFAGISGCVMDIRYKRGELTGLQSVLDLMERIDSWEKQDAGPAPEES